MPLPPKCRSMPTILSGSGDETLSLIHARQVLCKLSHIPSSIYDRHYLEQQMKKRNSLGATGQLLLGQWLGRGTRCFCRGLLTCSSSVSLGRSQLTIQTCLSSNHLVAGSRMPTTAFCQSCRKATAESMRTSWCGQC